MAAKAVAGKLSRRLQVRVLSGAPLHLYNNGQLHYEAQHSLDECAERLFFMVSVAQLVELRIVIPAVVGSSPIVHPIFIVFPQGIQPGNSLENRTPVPELIPGNMQYGHVAFKM